MVPFLLAGHNFCIDVLFLSTLHADSLAIGYGDFGSGEGFIHLSNFVCDGTEDTLFDCGASPVGQHFCNHGEDAGVICEGMRSYKCLHMLGTI